MIKFLTALCFTLIFNINALTAQNFSTHQVKNGETIQGIATRYGVTISDIYSLNPDAKKELKANTILIIPISKAKKPTVISTKELQGFKEHRTSKKETLYSIAKRYEITEDDIKTHNTFLYANTLQKGDKLQIPVFKIIKEEPKATTQPYIVKAKEGKWRIAYQFGITVEELNALNPGIGEILQEGQQVYVPNMVSDDVKEVDEKYSYYNVLPKEGFYRLKLKLGLEQATLEALNPELKDTGLKEGMVLKIPYSNKMIDTGGIVTKRTPLETKITNFDTKHIAIMLPFRLNRVDFDSISEIKTSIKKDPYLDASLDFYSGVLTALDSLKSLGISLKVDVYDTKYQISEVIKIIKNNNFEDVDAVIGPLTPETFDKVATELHAYNIPVVSPIGTNLKLYDNVFQSRPSDDLLKDRMVNFVKADSLVKNIVIVSDTKNDSVANKIKTSFSYAKSVYSRKNKQDKDENFVYVEDIRSALKPGRNIVFLETQSEGFVSNVTSILASLNQRTEGNPNAIEIILVTTNFNSAFEGDQVSNDHLSKLQFHFATASKSYNDTENNSFVKRYTKIYNTTPSKRAVKGFDLTMDVVLRLATAQDLYMSVNNAPLTEYVENKFAYKKKLLGGYYNDATYIVKYSDLTIIEVK
ncbi:LysM peptidoglycan-binding domain-containing protein [Mariniflexile litorale]|uniref:LysM peptidoglycan-binding domain-containing protein n=1 Tax=Mariniflexile litorale TaxID=3045158 RepID=A0AAU7EEV0_9FLAO|nr:LysM peptidoglycan-binding domain-containing protein [Mariniflexile sp. KMM 9835]MDQ8211628.1 LysM peptidoglycan-binding domain-containing protein [Mariniflexile sp. KMM 9835]